MMTIAEDTKMGITAAAAKLTTWYSLGQVVGPAVVAVALSETIIGNFITASIALLLVMGLTLVDSLRATSIAEPSVTPEQLRASEYIGVCSINDYSDVAHPWRATEPKERPHDRDAGSDRPLGIDPAHSRLGFSTRHAMDSRVRGAFNDVSSSADNAEELTDSKAIVVIETASTPAARTETRTCGRRTSSTSRSTRRSATSPPPSTRWTKAPISSPVI